MNTQPSNNSLNALTGAILILVFGLVIMLLATFHPEVPPARAALITPSVVPATNAAQPTIPAAQPVVQKAGKTVAYKLQFKLGGDPVMSYIGVGGSIDGKVDPTLTAEVGDKVQLTVVGDGNLHSLIIPAFNVNTKQFSEKNKTVVVEFTPTKPGDFDYYCDVPGHKDIGMLGKIHITGTALPTATPNTAAPAPVAAVAATEIPVEPADPNAVSVSRNPADVPAPVGNRAPKNIRVDLTTVEVSGKLADGTTYKYFTFDGKIPGPLLRIRIGDTVEMHLKNAAGDQFPHSIDLHAVTGPGGGAVYTQTKPGEETMFTFQAMNPGLYVYHCATTSIPHHIQSGMYGLILVEPEGGLPPVDHEFYIMQGEIYTEQPFGTKGNLTFSMDHMHHEDADYVVFNGAAGALTTPELALHAKVGETVRIFFGVGGPNYTSSFHVIGEIFDRVYDQASLTAKPLTDVQTTLVPPGGATMVEFKVNVPGRYVLVDHALTRLEKGLAGYLIVEGPDQPAILSGKAGDMTGH